MISPKHAVNEKGLTNGSPLYDFLLRLTDSHFGTLTKLAILKVPIPMECIRILCKRCARLEELFVVVDAEELVSLNIYFTIFCFISTNRMH